MTKSHRPTLGETLDHFARKAGDAGEFEAFGNAPPFLAPLAIDVGRLTQDAALVFEVGFDAREVEGGIVRIKVEANLAFCYERLQTDFRLLQGTGCRNLD